MTAPGRSVNGGGHRRRPPRRATAWAALCGALLVGAAQAAAAPSWPHGRPDYPMPPASEKRLFYLQRSTNTNTVVYDANFRRDGVLDSDEPVTAYWLRFNSSGEKRDLNFAERRFAYGVAAEPRGDREFAAHIVSFTDRSFRVFVDSRGRPRAVAEVAGRPAVLDWVFVKVDDGGFVPGVDYIEIYGHDVETGEALFERILPSSASAQAADTGKVGVD